MKKLFYFITSFIFLVVPMSNGYSSNVEPYDNAAADQQISDLFKSENFKKISIDYEWEDDKYTVIIIYNPMHENLLGIGLSKPVQWPYAITVDATAFPQALADHVKSLVPYELLNDINGIFDIEVREHYRKNPVYLYTSLQPILFLQCIENPDIDIDIERFFKSEKFEKKCLCYKLEGEYYPILLIHNPEKIKLRSSLSFYTREFGDLTHSQLWKKKNGIFAHKKTPEKLIQHLSRCGSLSWVEKRRNLSTRNGKYVHVYKTTIGGITSTGQVIYNMHDFLPFSWYEVMMNSQP